MSIKLALHEPVHSNVYVAEPVTKRALRNSGQSAASSAQELSIAIMEINRSAAQIIGRRQAGGSQAPGGGGRL